MMWIIIGWALVGLGGAYYRRAELADDTNEFMLDDMIIGVLVSMIFGPIMFGKPLADWLHRPIGSYISPPPIPPPTPDTQTRALQDRIKDLEEENERLKKLFID